MFYVYECSGCMYVCALTYVPDACKVQEMMLESLKQELERVHHVSARTQTYVLWQNSNC